MNKFFLRLSFIVCLLAIANSAPGYADDQASPVPPDNTRMNMPDRDSQSMTADQGGQHMSDTRIMSNIRKAVIGDSSLSTYAHNVKIISAGGKVTLKGPVRSDEERQNIQDKAASVAGASNVIDKLTVKPAVR